MADRLKAILNVHTNAVTASGTTEGVYTALDTNGVSITIDTSAVDIEYARLQAIVDSTAYARKREPLYPSLADFADAYYWSQKGDDSLMTAYIEACDKVKSETPKQLET